MRGPGGPLSAGEQTANEVEAASVKAGIAGSSATQSAVGATAGAVVGTTRQQSISEHGAAGLWQQPCSIAFGGHRAAAPRERNARASSAERKPLVSRFMPPSFCHFGPQRNSQSGLD
jgi:hypothetical protein